MLLSIVNHLEILFERKHTMCARTHHHHHHHHYQHHHQQQQQQQNHYQRRRRRRRRRRRHQTIASAAMERCTSDANPSDLAEQLTPGYHVAQWSLRRKAPCAPARPISQSSVVASGSTIAFIRVGVIRLHYDHMTTIMIHKRCPLVSLKLGCGDQELSMASTST